MQSKSYSLEFGGKTLAVEFTDLADQASSSLIMRYGETVVLATVVLSSHEKDGDFFPLTVDFEERFYAAGQILGSRFLRREGRPSDEAILAGRIIDRTIRPLFPKHIRNEVQVVITTLAIGEDDPDVLGINAASLALSVSHIPWNGPVGAIRIFSKDGKLVFNPAYSIRKGEGEVPLLDMVACVKSGQVVMVEVGANQASEELVGEALTKAALEIAKFNEFQQKIKLELGKDKLDIPPPVAPVGMTELFKAKIEPRLFEAVFKGSGKKSISTLEEEWVKIYKEAFPTEKVGHALRYFDESIDKLLHREALEKESRADGRTLNTIRPLYAKAGGISSLLHGSGIFYRGATHVFSALTLGGPNDSQLIDGVEGESKRRFMHHYNFPPFSTGETGRMGGLNRRMIGHGMLAEKALAAVIPPQESFPYTIRLVSESLASNGSTSMASVCASTLALMDGGVPIKRPVAGIAIGLMMGENGAYKILTDIQGPEDHHGDMDFKVAGTKEGVTAVQLDIKVLGVPIAILQEALSRAKEARLQILEVITKEISAPRKNLNPHAPEILNLKIKPDQIGLVIGSGGKTVKEIKEKTGADIEIEDDGTVYITGKGGAARAAKELIEEITHEFVAGEKIDGIVTKITDFGAFVKLNGSTEGMVHVSEVAPFRIQSVGEVLAIGQTVPVVIKSINERGQVSLSIKDRDPNFVSPGKSKPENENGARKRIRLRKEV